MFGFNEYSNGFMKGYQYYLYGVDDVKKEPVVDYGSLSSIGYYDGYNHAVYCERTFQETYVNHENMIAVVHKAYDRAIDKYRDYENKYTLYKDGFIRGKGEASLKHFESDETFNIIPEMDENDIDSISYHDGYCYELNRILNSNLELEELDNSKQNNSHIENVTREYFRQSYNNHPVFTDNSKTR